MVEWADVLKLSVPVALAKSCWLLNEHSKRQWERHKRKEDRYIALLTALKGFYVSADPQTATIDKNMFIQQLSLAWLYCPDSVIRNGYRFLESAETGVCEADEEKERSVGELVLCMRNDPLGRRLLFWR